MFHFDTLLITFALVLDLLLLVDGSTRILTFSVGRPRKNSTLQTLQSSERGFRTVAIPAVAASVTGLISGLAASYLHSGFDSGSEHELQIGAILAAGSVVVLVVLLNPALKGDPEIQDLVHSPQGVLAAARHIQHSVDTTVDDIEALDQTLVSWERHAAAYAMGWPRKQESLRLNSAMHAVPADTSLGCKDAARALRGRHCFRAALTTAPFSFGWPIGALLLLHSAGSVLLLVSREPTVPELGVLAIIASMSVLVILFHGYVRLLVGARNLAFERSFLQAAHDEVAAARKLIGAATERDIDGSALKVIKKELARTQIITAAITLGGVAAASAISRLAKAQR